MIYNTVEEFVASLNEDEHFVITSGGFDPIHIGHVRCIRESAAIANEKGCSFAVIVNGDGFLKRKKGKGFMPLAERLEIVAAIKGVDYAVGWEDNTQTVSGAIDLIKPDFFTKGGDRAAPEDIPEWETCERVGCEVIFNVGGGKIQSSSELIKNSKVD